MPRLAEAGLGLQSVMTLPDRTGGDELLDDVLGSVTGPSGYRSLVMLGQAGPSFWDRTVRHHLDRRDPFDQCAVELVTDWFERDHPEERFELLYPGDAPVPLGRLAQRAGWGRPSPLGLTIHPRFGLWIAHRAVFVTTLDLAPTSGTPGDDHPCDRCVDRPCQTACPAGAVSVETGFGVEACGDHRLSEGSACRHQCLARNACPVGAEFRYGPDQMAHHYASGLASIVRWRGRRRSTR